MEHVEITHHPDLTDIGFSGDEIRTLYYTQEPMMQAIVEAASQMNEHSRYLALALMQTIVVVASVRPEAKSPDVKMA